MISSAEAKHGRKVALVIAGLNAGLVVIASLAYAINLPPEFFPEGIPWVLSMMINSLLALLILYHQPGHIIGWLFVLVSFLATFPIWIGTFSSLDPQYLEETVNTLALFLIEVSWLIVLFIPLTLVLQYFPNGRLLTRRWWPLPVATVLAIFLTAASYIPSILGLAEEDSLVELLGVLSIILFASAILGSLASVVVRFRRSRDIERLQMKWLVYTAAVGILLQFVLTLLMDDDYVVLTFYTTSLPAILALAMTAAILRYRLYDIDIIIRRTLQYGIVTGILALVYFGLVVIFQGIFAAVGDQQSGFFIVGSTLVIAALFNPVRKRVQHAVDRRFYRQKYQAEQILADFAAVARDEVDLDQIAAALMVVVEETMKPERASLTLLKKIKGEATASGQGPRSRPIS